MGMNGVGAFFDGFSAAYDTTGRVLRDWELAKIAREGVKAVPGGNPVAQKDIQAEIDNDPAVAAAQPGPGTRYQLLGQTYDAQPNEQDVTRARQLAMAGVFEKYGEVGHGMGMRREVRRDQLAEEEAKAAPLRRKQLELDVKGRERANADDEARRGVDAEVGAWMKDRLRNPDGTERPATVDDYLAATQYKVGKLASAGQSDAAGKALAEHQAQAFAKINLENAERQEAIGRAAAGLAAGDLGAVRDFYNRYVPDGAQVTDIKRSPSGGIVIERAATDGTKLAPVTMKDPTQLSAMLASFKDPMALYQWSQGEFQRNMMLRQDSRAGAAAGRAQAEFDSGAPERELKANLAKLGLTATDPNATPEQRQQARALLVEAKGADQNAPAQVKLAQAMVASGLRPDMKSALEFALTAKDKSPDAVRNEIYKTALTANMGNAEAAQKTTEEAMRYLQAPAAAAGPKPASQADAHAQAQAAIAGGADKAAVNARLKQMGFSPLP